MTADSNITNNTTTVAGESQGQANARAEALANLERQKEVAAEQVAKYGSGAAGGYMPSSKEVAKADIKIAANAKALEINDNVKNFAIAQSITEKQAAEVLGRYKANPNSSEFKSLTSSQIASMNAAISKESNPWDIAQEAISQGEKIYVNGQKVELATTPQAQAERYKTQQEAVATLKNANLITKTGEISQSAYTSNNPKIQQALRDLHTEKEYKTQRAIGKALEGTPVEKIAMSGIGSEAISKVYDLSKLRSSKALIPVGQEGMYNIDPMQAIKAGFNAEKLGNLGFLVDKSYFEKAQDSNLNNNKNETGGYYIIDKSGKLINVDKESFYKYGEELEKYYNAVENQKSAIDYLKSIPNVYNKDNSYNLSSAIVVGVPNSIILNAGFTQEQIDLAKKNSTLTNEKLSNEAYVTRYFIEKGWELPSYMGGTINRAIASRNVLDELDSHLIEATKSYKEKYGTGDWLKSAGISATSELFPAARSWYPEVTIKDITPYEWIVTGVNAAMLGYSIAEPKISALKASKISTPKLALSENAISMADVVKVPEVNPELLPKGKTILSGEWVEGKGPQGLKVYGESGGGYTTLYSSPKYPTTELIPPKTIADIMPEIKSLKPLGKFEVYAKGIKGEIPSVANELTVETIKPIETIGGNWLKGTGRTITQPKVLPVTGGGVSIGTIAATQTVTVPATGQYVFLWYEIGNGGIITPKISNVPTPVSIPSVKVDVTKIKEPIEVPVVNPTTITTGIPETILTNIEVPITSPIPNQSEIINPITTSVTNIENETSIVPEPITNPVPTIPITIPTLIINTPDYIPETPAPSEKFKIILPELPGFPSLYSGGGSYAKHGLHSTYVKFTQNIPEIVVYLPTWEGLKSPRMDNKLWKKLGRQQSSIEVLSEEEFEDTPFGKKAVRQVTNRIKLQSGARQSNSNISSKLLKKINRNENITPKDFGSMGI